MKGPFNIKGENRDTSVQTVSIVLKNEMVAQITNGGDAFLHLLKYYMKYARETKIYVGRPTHRYRSNY